MCSWKGEGSWGSGGKRNLKGDSGAEDESGHGMLLQPHPLQELSPVVPQMSATFLGGKGVTREELIEALRTQSRPAGRRHRFVPKTQSKTFSWEV